MTDERWRQIESLFAEAVECPPAERQRFLDRVCQSDDDLRRELESLLACDAPEQRLVVITAVAGVDSDNGEPDAEMAGRRIGPYRLLRLIGHGGMGAVYLGVRDDDQYQKQVAVKLLKRGMDTDFMLSRFRQERQILANLEHPFIARMLDGGATADGLPYFVMEYVDGVPITRYCEEKSLSLAERLRLFRLVCEAVQYAHQNLVVHRDLKPSNILTTQEGVPKLLDFGIAKVLDPRVLESATVTRVEQRMLTPDYASPEQFKGLPISTASDTYSLGAVLYELLTAKGPHQFTSNSLADLEMTICETEPEKPSIAIARNASMSPAVRKQLRRQLAGDLDTIILTAMRKEPQRRYASAAEFSDDIRRHMEGLPIAAREDQWSYRVSKFVQRNRLGVAAAALVLVSLIGGIVATTIQARRAERRFDIARQLAGAVMQVVGGTLARMPGATAARAEMLQLVVQYLDRLAQEPGSDPNFQLEIADAYRAVAAIQGNPMRQNLGQPAEALRNYERALGLYKAVYDQFAAPTRVHALSGLIGANIEAGDIEIRTGNPAAGGLRLNAARAFAAEATAKDPGVLTPGTSMYLYFRLGEAAVQAGDMEQARSYYRTAVEVCIEWNKVQPDANSRVTLRGAYTHLAGVQLAMGDLDEARKNYEIALRQNEAAMGLADLTTYERFDLAESHENLADILGNPDDLNFGDRAAAVSHYRLAVQITEGLARADPEDVRAQDDVAETYRGLGATLLYDQPAESLAFYEKAAAISKTVSDADPANMEYRRDYAAGLVGAGEALRLLGRGREALQKLTPALQHMQALSGQLRDQVSVVVSLGRIQRDLGDALLAIGDQSASLERYKQALATHQEAIRRVPANLYYQRQYADSMEAMARYYMTVEKRKEARVWLDKCSAFWQDWTRRKLATPYARARERQISVLIESIDKAARGPETQGIITR